MSYNVVQKIRNNYYLYEVTSTWDPVSKRSKQSRKYIGRCDQDGNLQDGRDTEISVRDAGDYWLLYKIAEQCGLWNALNKTLGSLDAGLTLAYSMVRCLRNTPPTQASYAVRSSIILDVLDIPLDSKWLTMNSFLNGLESVYNRRDVLFGELPHDDVADVFELDIFNTPLRFYQLYGSSGHDNFNHFPRRSIYIAQGKEVNQPFYFRFANYSGSDKGTLKDIVSELAGLGVKKVNHFLGEKSYSEQEIASKISIDYGISLILGDGSPIFSTLLSENIDLSSYSTVVDGGLLYRYKRFRHDFGPYACDVWIIYNGREYEESVLSFYSKLSQFEETIGGLKWSKGISIRLENMYGFSDILRYFELCRADDGGVVIKRVQSEINSTEMKLGRLVFISSSETTFSEIMSIMHRYDRLSQDLTIFKTDLQGGASLFPSNESAVASIMCDFMSMIMKTSLIDRMNATGLQKKMNYLDVLSETSMIKAFKVNGVSMMNPLTDTQVEIFRSLGIEPPPACRNSRAGKSRCRPCTGKAEAGRCAMPGDFSSCRTPSDPWPSCP